MTRNKTASLQHARRIARAFLQRNAGITYSLQALPPVGSVITGYDVSELIGDNTTPDGCSLKIQGSDGEEYSLYLFTSLNSMVSIGIEHLEAILNDPEAHGHAQAYDRAYNGLRAWLKSQNRIPSYYSSSMTNGDFVSKAHYADGTEVVQTRGKEARLEPGEKDHLLDTIISLRFALRDRVQGIEEAYEMRIGDFLDAYDGDSGVYRNAVALIDTLADVVHGGELEDVLADLEAKLKELRGMKEGLGKILWHQLLPRLNSIQVALDGLGRVENDHVGRRLHPLTASYPTRVASIEPLGNDTYLINLENQHCLLVRRDS